MKMRLFWRVAVFGVAAVVTPAVWRPLDAQTPTAGGPSPCNAASAPIVQAPSAGVFPIAGGFAIVPSHPTSLDNAAAQYDFPLLLPTQIPDGYQLGEISFYTTLVAYIGPPERLTSFMPPAMDLVEVCYVTSDGSYLRVSQGYPFAVGPMETNPYQGTTTVHDHDAYWTLGHFDAGFWEPGFQLAWKLDTAVPRPPGAFVELPGGQVTLYLGYQLTSDGLSLDQLVAIADSVQTYQGP